MNRRMTPWGVSQDADELAEGIIFHSTASHGGIWLSAERRKKLNWDKNWLGSAEWWEEDCDASIPYWFFRDDIANAGREENQKTRMEHAINNIKRNHPEFAKREGLI